MSNIYTNPESEHSVAPVVPPRPEAEQPVARKTKKQMRKAAKTVKRPTDNTPSDPPAKKKANGNWGMRILALVLAVVGAAIPFALGVFVLKAEGAEKMKLMQVLQGLPSCEKAFGFLPVYSSTAGIALIGGIGLYVFLLFLVVSTVLGLIAFFTKNAPKLLRVQALLLAIGYLAHVVCVILGGGFDAAKLDFVSIAVGVVALVVFLIACVAASRMREKAPVAEPPAVPQYIVEEFAEAMPYDGGPVEGVEIAEEVNPTFEPEEMQGRVTTAGYDFYNCKSFDPFIATLNNEERNQFTEIFILKCKGVMPEIPEYEVGGNNKEFFRRLFIYLGQYRDRIPDGLLAKIYQFAIKIP